jgi:hypothetical protein
MDTNRSQSDMQQKQPRGSSWAKKLRSPKTWFLIVRVGFTVYEAGKWLIKIIESIGF